MYPFPSFPGSSDSKEPAFNTGDPGSIPGPGRSPGEGNGNPFQDSCLENSMDRGIWQVTNPWGHKELDMTELLTLSLHFPCLHRIYGDKDVFFKKLIFTGVALLYNVVLVSLV